MSVTDDQALVREANRLRQEGKLQMTETSAKYEAPPAQNGLATLQDTEDVFKLGDVLFKSGYFSDVKSAAQAVVKILRGRELGIGAVTAMEQIHVVQGKTGLGAALIGAKIKQSGRYDYQVAELTDTRCELVFFERGKEIGRSEFDMKDAETAGLVKRGDNYQKFPRNMLLARALTNGARWYTPDVFGGAVYTPEELRGIDPADAAVPTATPEPQETHTEEAEAKPAKSKRRQSLEDGYTLMYERYGQQFGIPALNPEWTDEDLQGTGNHWKGVVQEGLAAAKRADEAAAAGQPVADGDLAF